MLERDTISSVLSVSRDVILDCAQKNGAIIAANPGHPAYPEGAKNYRYAWVRDASFACVALDRLEKSAKLREYARLESGGEVQDRFFKWCMKAEGFRKTGLFFENYHVNGRKARRNFQPDQNGLLLFAVHHHVRAHGLDAEKFEALVRKAADGLLGVWKTDHFSVVTNDLWEERFTFPDLKENFTYSAAACSAGLKCAHELIPEEKWIRASSEMESALRSHFAEKDHLYRSFGKFYDSRIDASLLALVYPFSVYRPSDAVMRNTVREIENCLGVSGGITRYEGDDYDGWMYRGRVHRKKGAGTWPLLNFFLSIYYSFLGDRKKAAECINAVLSRLDGGFIPEQQFNNSVQQSIRPLAWSHSMLVIAIDELLREGKR